VSYKQITREERYSIHRLLRQGLCPARIARILDRHRSTISREIARNLHTNGCYIDYRAQFLANGRRSRCRRKAQFGDGDWSLVRHFIKEDWSPEQVSLVFAYYGVLGISHETIYRYIWRNKKQGGRLYRHLRQSPKQRRKRYRAYDSRGVLRGKHGLVDRPEAANERLEKGHVEVDLMHSAKSRDCLLTLVDRMTRLVWIWKLKDKTKEEVAKAIIGFVRKHEIKTLTADNGSEFHDYKSVESATGAKFYFAAPYHSWERGTSENTNGLIRQYVPKRVSIARYTQADCDAIAARLNSRPRKILNLRTPEEAHYGSEGFVALAG
jgi:IS30 family transposase